MQITVDYVADLVSSLSWIDIVALLCGIFSLLVSLVYSILEMRKNMHRSNIEYNLSAKSTIQINGNEYTIPVDKEDKLIEILKKMEHEACSEENDIVANILTPRYYKGNEVMAEVKPRRKSTKKSKAAYIKRKKVLTRKKRKKKDAC